MNARAYWLQAAAGEDEGGQFAYSKMFDQTLGSERQRGNFIFRNYIHWLREKGKSRKMIILSKVIIPPDRCMGAFDQFFFWLFLMAATD